MADTTKKGKLSDRLDAFGNETLGVAQAAYDKRQGGIPLPPQLNVFSRNIFENLYHGDDVGRTGVDLPAQEMVREWITLNAGTINEAGVEASVGKKVLKIMQKLEAQKQYKIALAWESAFGGSVLLIGANDGTLAPDGTPATADNPLAEPLREDAIQSVDFIKPIDRFDAVTVQRDQFGEPEIYQITLRRIEGAALSSMFVHHSRVIVFPGLDVTNNRRAELDGWGDSIYQRTFETMRDYSTGWAGIGALLTDLNQSVYKVSGLTEMLSTEDATDGTRTLAARLRTLEFCRSVLRAIPLDADLGEEWERRATNFGGLADVLDRMALRLAQAFRVPVSLLLGQSPAGLQATGDSDIRFWYDSVRAQQQFRLLPRISRLVDLILLSKDGPTNGVLPDDVSITFNPLYQESPEELTARRKTQAEIDVAYINAGILLPDEVRNSRFGGEEYSFETQLDPELKAEKDAEAAELATQLTQEPPTNGEAPEDDVPADDARSEDDDEDDEDGI